MRPVVSVAEMRQIDAQAQRGVPLEALVERAGRAVARAGLGLLGGAYGRRVVVVAGKGHNGDDGRVAAGRLRRGGVRVTVVEAAEAEGQRLAPCDLVVDAGSLLYSQSPVPPHLDQQEELKADLLRSIYQKDLEVGAIGLGPADLAKGSVAVRMPRQVVNTDDPTIPTEAPKVVQLGSSKVGVFGVVGGHGGPRSLEGG